MTEHPDDTPLWTPSPDRAAAAAMSRFAAAQGRADTVALHRWSVEQPEAFWAAAWDWCGMPGEPGERVLERGASMRDARFFPDARLNVAEAILDGRGAAPDAEMLVSIDEREDQRVLTRAEVRALVGEVAAALRAEGVVPGDRVAAWMPNIAETVVVMLAAASIGAVFSSTSPDFGTDGVVDRFGQIEPVVLVAADGYTYGGNEFDGWHRMAEIRESLPSVRRLVVVPNLVPVAEGEAPVLPEPFEGLDSIPDAVMWADWLAPHRGAEPVFEQLPFDHPWYVLYSSGTTGVPKCIVHRAGGVLLKHLVEHQLHCDIGSGDRVMYFTTCGWMMWNWLASVPASGATAVLYDGSPFHPGPSALADIAMEQELTFLGVGAKYLDSLRKDGYRPGDHHHLPQLRTIASTGSPLSPESFAWVHDAWKADVHLASISGGTDLCGCFVAGDPTRPVWAGEIQGPGLGMAVDVWSEDGAPAGVEERGELVCTEPFPSMPLGFWGDESGERYRAAYYDRFAGGPGGGIWAHGDFASWTRHGGMVVHGRSDTTLNPGGVRIGTAEIYRRVEQIDEVVESLVFGQDWDGDVRIVLLVRLADGVALTDELVASIRTAIRVGCTPRHVPAVVLAVDDLPRTRSGKLAELAVTDAVAGREVRNTTALANPECLAVIAGRAELRV